MRIGQAVGDSLRRPVHRLCPTGEGLCIVVGVQKSRDRGRADDEADAGVFAGRAGPRSRMTRDVAQIIHRRYAGGVARDGAPSRPPFLNNAGGVINRA